MDCDNLERYFKQIGGEQYSCVCLHGDRKPNERKENLELFKSNQRKFLICTDVAARGIDITGLPFSEYHSRHFQNVLSPNNGIEFSIYSDQYYIAGREIELCASNWSRWTCWTHGLGYKSGVKCTGEGVVSRRMVSLTWTQLLEHEFNDAKRMLRMAKWKNCSFLL